MSDLHFVFDFPERRVFRNPVDMIRATRIEEVVPALRAVEAACVAGRWAAGFVCYEAAPAFDAAMKVKNSARMPLLLFGIFDAPATTDSECDVTTADYDSGALHWTEETSDMRFHTAIGEIHEAIAAGETYQVNYTNRLRTTLTGDAFAWYEELRRAQGSGLHAYLDFDDFTVVSASPELFFDMHGGRIRTRPMKGTRPRGRWIEEDTSNATDLVASPKDRAENLMIVDLLRNDIGRICETGSVNVPSLYDVESFNTVWQLTSRVEGSTRKGVGVTDVFHALFPCGSVTGAPKINTMKWIARLEDSTREVYCGAIGVIEPGGDCTFSVPIRTAWIDKSNRQVTYGVGSGITADSDAADELDELHAKSSLLHKRAKEFQLFETMRVEEGLVLRCARHVTRLLESARYFGFQIDVQTVDRALDDAVAGAPTVARLKLFVSRGGTCSVEVNADVPQRFSSRDMCRSTGAVERIVLASNPISSLDPFMCHKTTERSAYDAHRSEKAFDTMLWNEKGRVTEFTIGNAVFEIGGELVTPPRTDGLLAGTFRAQLLDDQTIREHSVNADDVARCTRIWLINSLREWVEVSLDVNDDTGRLQAR